MRPLNRLSEACGSFPTVYVGSSSNLNSVSATQYLTLTGYQTRASFFTTTWAVLWGSNPRNAGELLEASGLATWPSDFLGDVCSLP